MFVQELESSEDGCGGVRRMRACRVTIAGAIAGTMFEQ